MKVMLGVMVALMFVALPAMAIPPVTAPPVSDSMTIYDPAGAVVDGGQLVVYENDEDPNVIYTIDLSYIFINDQPLEVVDSSKYGFATTLYHPDESYSDVFGVVFGANTETGYALGFSSDGEGIETPYGASGYYFLPEGDGIFDATMYLNPELVRLGYTAEFRSDTDSIPEPAPLALMGIGAIALSSLRKARRTV